MSEGRLPPHDTDAEVSTIGAMLLSTDAVRDVLAILQPGDFYVPQHQLIYGAISTLRKNGQAIDAVTVASSLAANHPDEGWLQRLLEAQSLTPTISAAATYAGTVARCASLRSIIRLAADLTERAYLQDDPHDIIDSAKGRLAESTLRAVGDDVFDKLTTFEQFVRTAGSKPVDWAIPGVLGRRERLLIVAPEGAGKGVLMRQFAIAMGGGVHPFTQGPVEPCDTLYLDLENSERTIAHQAELSLHGARRMFADGPNRAWILSEEAGLDLRSSMGQVYLEKAMQAVRPAILCIGPIYKAARKRANEQWEEATLDLFAVLDDIRVRFDCALIMEHHAPKGAGVRDLLPFGASAWLRWPEYGYKLEPKELDRQGRPLRLEVGTFRGNRMETSWPDELVRGGDQNLPWVGRSRPR